jgi:hypothetical protein
MQNSSGIARRTLIPAILLPALTESRGLGFFFAIFGIYATIPQFGEPTHPNV